MVYSESYHSSSPALHDEVGVSVADAPLLRQRVLGDADRRVDEDLVQLGEVLEAVAHRPVHRVDVHAHDVVRHAVLADGLGDGEGDGRRARVAPLRPPPSGWRRQTALEGSWTWRRASRHSQWAQILGSTIFTEEPNAPFDVNDKVIKINKE